MKKPVLNEDWEPLYLYFGTVSVCILMHKQTRAIVSRGVAVYNALGKYDHMWCKKLGRNSALSRAIIAATPDHPRRYSRRRVMRWSVAQEAIKNGWHPHLPGDAFYEVYIKWDDKPARFTPREEKAIDMWRMRRNNQMLKESQRSFCVELEEINQQEAVI